MAYIDIDQLEDLLPDGLARRLRAQYGDGLFGKILKGFAAKRKVTLRANPLKSNADAIAAQLNETGIAWSRAAFYPDAFVVEQAREDAIRSLAAYDEGELYLQSLSAMLPALALEPRAGENILDMTAAPGGKTCQISALSGGKALICACEKNHVRAEKLRYNLGKQGVSRVNVMECDARKLDDFFTFDKVLLDAPCSGSGTVSLASGRCKTGFTEALLARSAKTQQALLHKALGVLKPGGTMVYATCSILAEENEDVLARVLPKAEAEVEPLPEGLLEDVPLLPCRLPEAAVVMPTDRYEGFFLALIKKK